LRAKTCLISSNPSGEQPHPGKKFRASAWDYPSPNAL
jgi:hypothetical protein